HRAVRPPSQLDSVRQALVRGAQKLPSDALGTFFIPPVIVLLPAHVPAPASSAATRSSATPSGPVPDPRASLLSARRSTSMGQPNCNAKEAAIAPSLARIPAPLPAR